MASKRRVKAAPGRPSSVRAPASESPRIDAMLQPPSAARFDGWGNILTGLGKAARDKTLSNAMEFEALMYQELKDLYRGCPLASKIVDLPADETTREWLDVLVDDDADLAKAVAQRGDELKVRARFNEAERWGRQFGGAGILLGADDGQPATKPLDLKRIKSFGWMTTLTCQELQVSRWYVNPMAPKFGEPRMFRVTPAEIDIDDLPREKRELYPEVHESRVLRFIGTPLTRDDSRSNHFPGWGDSILQRIHRAVGGYQMGWQGVFILLQELWLGVMKMQNLGAMLAAGQDEAVKTRLIALDLGKSLAKTIAIDKEEEYTRDAPALTGVEGTLTQAATFISALARIPMTLLFGNASSGLQSNTGQSDHRWFYNSIAAHQRNDTQPLVERYLKVLFASPDGPTKGKEPKTWSIRWRPLWQMNDGEKAELRLKNAQADKSDVDSGILLPEEVALSRYRPDGYSSETQLIEPEMRRVLIDRAVEQAENPPPPPTQVVVAPGAKPPKPGAPQPKGAPTPEPGAKPEEEKIG